MVRNVCSRAVCALFALSVVVSADAADRVVAETLESPSMRLEFADADHGYGLIGVVNRLASDRRFVEGSSGVAPDLWQIEFIRRDTRKTVAYSNLSASGEKSVAREDGRLVFRWKNVPLPDGDGSFDLAAVVEIDSDGASVWRLKCRNRGQHYALRWTRYPVLSRVTKDGEADLLRPYHSTGMKLLRHYKHRSTMLDWPSPGPYPMVFSYLIGDAGLYFAAQDGESHYKRAFLDFEKDKALTFDTTVKNSGIVGKAADGPGYPVVLRCYKGNWWESARIYGEWAHRQKWCEKGPIAVRGGSAKSAADRQLWINCGGDADGASNVVERMEVVWPGLIKGFEWCLWYHQPDNFATPEFFPGRKGMERIMKMGVDRGLLMMPYVNTRLWDAETVGFRYGKGDSIKREFGDIAYERYGTGGFGPPGVKHAYGVMCPCAKGWQDAMVEICAKLMTNVNANAVYFDQITGAPPILCYDPSHGHTLGGGTWWESGHREMLQRIRDVGEQQGGIVMTSEQAAENWMDLVDALMLPEFISDPKFSDEQVPFWQAVYSGWTTYYGYQGVISDAPADYFRKIMKPFLWGIVPGWLNPGMVVEQKFRPIAEIIGKLARFRAAHMEFFAYGRLVGDLMPLEPSEGVAGACWQTLDGKRMAMAIANSAMETWTVRFRFPGESTVRTVTLDAQGLDMVVR